MENVSFESTKFKGAKIDGFIFNDNYCYSADGIGQREFNDWIKKQNKKTSHNKDVIGHNLLLLRFW